MSIDFTADANARALHDSAVVFDGLSCSNFSRSIFEEMRAGGITTVNCSSVLWENFVEGIEYVAAWNRWLNENADILMPVKTVADIASAKQQNKTGIVLGFQNTSPIEDRLAYIEIFKQLGVGFMQMTYNTQNFAGSGYLEPNDSGLSGFGREMLHEMNRVGVVCDMSHVGLKTSADIIAHSKKPVCFSHVLPSALHDVARNKPDALFTACVEQGGIIGLSLFAPGLKAGNDATVEDYVDAIGHIVALVGEEHVGLGLDFSLDHPRPGPYQNYASRDKGYARNLTEFATAKISKPKGIERYGMVPNVTAAMVRRGWSEATIRRLLGENWLAFLRRVW